MRKVFIISALSFLLATAAQAQEAVDPTTLPLAPGMEQPQPEVPNPVVTKNFVAKVRVVNRDLDVSKTYSAKPLEIINHKDELRIQVASCVFDNDNLNGGDAAYLSVIGEKGEPVFNGWLFSKFISASAVEHPKYDVFLVSCIPTK